MFRPSSLLIYCLPVACVLLAGCERQEDADYPVANVGELVYAEHGRGRSDPYAWMGGLDQEKELLSYIGEEGAYFAGWMGERLGVQEQLLGEFHRRLPDEVQAPPVVIDGYDYWREYRAGRQYPFFMRRKGGGAAEVLLDANEMAQGGYLGLKGMELGPGGERLLFSADLSGDESYGLWLKRVGVGEAPVRIAAGTAGSAAFDESGCCGYFVRRDGGVDGLYRHHFQTGDEELVHREEDGAFRLSVYRSGEGVVLRSESLVTNQLWLVQGGKLSQVTPRLQGVQSRLVVRQGTLYLLTNEGGNGYRLLKGQLGSLEELPIPANGNILDYEVGTSHISVLTRNTRMHYAIVATDHAGELIERIEAPAPTSVVSLRSSSRPGVVQFETTSLTSPKMEHEVVLAAGDSNGRKEQAYTKTAQSKAARNAAHLPTTQLHHSEEEPGQYSPASHLSPAKVTQGRKHTGAWAPPNSPYTEERLWYAASDGTQVPVTLAYRRTNQALDKRPLLVAVYGAYGISADLSYDPKRLSLLDRGLIYAVVHVRGGGELGEDWHKAGKGRHKLRSAEDLVDGIRFLVEAGYGAPKRVILRGRSAGGALVGYVANAHPRLVAGIVAREPFVDLITALKAGSPADWDEWGNPGLPSDYQTLATLSPYDNIRRQAWPAIFVTGAYRDARVHVSQPLKWAARLRANQRGRAPILVDIDMSAGHLGPSDRYDAHKSVAEEYTFILTISGIMH